MRDYIDDTIGFHQNPKESRNKWNALDAVGSEHMGTGREDLLLLKYILLANRPLNVVETGTYRGYGSICILEALLDDYQTGHKFLTIEHKQSLRDIAYKNAEKFSKNYRENFADRVTDAEMRDLLQRIARLDVKFEVGDSGNEEHYEKMFGGEKIDFVYLDCGNRQGAFNAIYPFLRDNAILLMHDAWDRKEKYEEWMEEWMIEGKIHEYLFIPSERGMALMRASTRYQDFVG